MANLNIAIKKDGDRLTAGEFNQVVKAVNDIPDNSLLLNILKTDVDKVKSEVDAIKATSSAKVISLSEEMKYGQLNYSDKLYDIFECTAEIVGLPVNVGQTIGLVLLDFPAGDNLLLTVDCFSVVSADGKFKPNAYRIDSIETNEALDTLATITCLEEIAPSKVLMTVRYVKGLISYDILQIRIPMSDLTTGIEGVNLSIPACKYNKTFALSFVGDDSLMGIYQRAFNYIFARWVDDKPTLHDTEAGTTGITPSRMLTYTDGAGNDIPFRLGVNWMDSKPGSNYHTDGNTFLPYMWWSEGKRFYDYFNAILNHGGGNQDDPLSSITKNQKEITANMGMIPFALGVPGGTSGYPEAAQNIEDLYMIESSGFRDAGEIYPKLSNITGNVMKKRFGRKCIDTYTLEQIKETLITYAKDSHWINLFCHNIQNSQSTVNGQLNADVCFAFLDYVYDTYGKGGNDSVWFASDTEIFEYLFTRLNSIITKKVDGDSLLVSIKAAKLPNFYYKELSLSLQGVNTMANAVYNGIIQNFSATPELLNLMYSERAVSLAEKYTLIFEANTSASNKKEAYFFVNRLREDLAAPFIARLHAGEVPPILTDISINAGALVTYSRDVVIDIALTGIITHYRVSEQADLSTLPWTPGASKQIAFNLSGGYESKTIYVQVKNAYGPSEVKSSVISLEERPANLFTVTGESNNVNYGNVSPSTQEVVQGGIANFVAQAEQDYVIESWTNVSSATGIGTASGSAQVSNVQADKTVICNFKPVGSSGGGSAKIILIPTDINAGVTTLPNGIKATWIRTPFASSMTDTPFVTTTGEYAGKKVVLQADLPIGVLDMLISTSANPVLSGNTGVYPDEYINVLYGVYDSGTYPASRGIVRLKDMKTGVYNIRVLFSTAKILNSSQIAGITYEANGILVNPPSEFNPLNNDSTFIDINNVVVGSDGVLDIYMGNTASWVRTGFNLIEIEEV